MDANPDVTRESGDLDATGFVLDEDRTRLAGASLAAHSDTGPLVSGQAFGTRYDILRLLGIGGMGAVYQAWDRELGVVVALKVVRPEAAADPEAAASLERRFKQELLLARQVTHKNVVRIHDLGEVHGVKYITMPYIEGEDLASILRREGTLPVARVLKIARAVTDGLTAAHAAGVVHRDLKPANIMIDADDEALIMDFGIARSTGAPPTGNSPRGVMRTPAAGQTVAGAIVGTLEYMAPEQAQARPVDHRADIYAAGLIIYDMLVGRRRQSRAESAIAELMSRTLAAPPSIRTVAPQIPEALDRIVLRCLDPNPDARFATTTELLTELDALDEDGNPKPVERRIGPRLAVAVLLAFVALLALTWRLARGPAVPAARDPLSILVTDFHNGTKDPVFDGSLEQALAIGIEQASFVNTFDRESARRLARQLDRGERLDEDTSRLIATREGIRLLLTGAIEPAGTGYALRISGVDPGEGKALWDVRGTAKGKPDVLSTLATIAAGVREEMGDTAVSDDTAVAGETFTTGSVEAVRSYVLAQDLALGGKFAEAIPHYNRAIEQDPNFGRAHANLGTALFYLGRKAESEEKWKTALSLADRMTERERYRTQGLYSLLIARNYEQARDTYRTLLDKYPGEGGAHNNLAMAYFNVLDFRKALEHGRRVVELYPNNVLGKSNYALYAMYASDFETAAKQAQELVKTYPDFFNNYLPLAIGAAMAGKYDAAERAYRKMAATGPQGASVAATGLADLAQLRGRYAEAESLLKQGIAVDRQHANAAGLAAKHVALAELYEATRRLPLASQEAANALESSRDEAVLVPVARLFARVGRSKDAESLAAEIENLLQTKSGAYASIIRSEVALAAGRRAVATEGLREALKRADLWLARFAAGVAYVQAGHDAQALPELEACMNRRGEAAALFLDDTPTLRYLAILPYWLGRAQQGVGQTSAALENFKAFVALRQTATLDDPLVADARRRAGL